MTKKTSLLQLLILSVVCVVSFSAKAYKAGDETENFCSTSHPQVCAHLRFLSEVNSSVEGELIAHILTPNRQEVENFNFDLWMDMGSGHGHGSAPVDFEKQSLNHYKITNAWFVMQGQWLARLTFTLGGVHHEISIPIDITE